MRSRRAAAVGPGSVRALQARPAAGGRVELAFGPGGYVRLGEHWILLAPARSPLGPLSILVAGLARDDLVPGDPVAASDEALVAGALQIDLTRAREAPPPERRPLRRGWRAALAAALDAVAPAPAALAPGRAALAAGDLAGGLARLAGRGEGLTPAGDDVLAGFAAWRWARGAPVALPAERCAPLGRAYLRCAERGELAAPAAGVLEAIANGDAPAAARRARGLAAWGATSGAALLWGIAAGGAETARAATRQTTPATSATTAVAASTSRTASS